MPARLLPKARLRTGTIHVKVTRAEKRELEKRASAAGLKTGPWLRFLGLRRKG